MHTVSDAYKTAIAANRRQMFAMVKVSFSDPFLDPSVSVIANELARISHPEQSIIISIDQENEGQVAHKYASLDGSWILDGSYYLAPETEAEARANFMGWWGLFLAGVGGALSVTYPTLTATFSERAIMAVALAGDSKRGEYPVDFMVYMYDAGNTLIYTETVTGNTNVSWSLEYGDSYIPGIVKLVLEVRRWSHVGRQVKIAGFFAVMVVTYLGDKILQLGMLEEREFSTGSLPIGNISANEITVKLDNSDHVFDAGETRSVLHNLVKANRKIKPYIGIELADHSIEWMPLGVFFSGEWSVPEGDIYAETTARDRLELLTKSTYSGPVFINKTYYDMAVAVLGDTGYAYWVDTELQNYTVPYGWFDSVSHRECLRIIAEACIGQAYADKTGTIRLEGPSYLATYKNTPVANITRSQYFKKDNPASYVDLANYIELYTQPLVPDAVASEMYRSDNPESIGISEVKTVTVYYTNKPVIEAVASISGQPSGAVISAITYYAWGADVTVSGATVAGTFTVIVSGKKLTVSGSRKITASDDTSIRENGKLIYSFANNPLIQTAAIGQTIADKCLAMSKDARRNLDLEWCGDPALELGDMITVPDSRTTTADFYITSQNIDFDGELTANIKGKKVL